MLLIMFMMILWLVFRVLRAIRVVTSWLLSLFDVVVLSGSAVIVLIPMEFRLSGRMWLLRCRALMVTWCRLLMDRFLMVTSLAWLRLVSIIAWLFMLWVSLFNRAKLRLRLLDVRLVFMPHAPLLLFTGMVRVLCLRLYLIFGGLCYDDDCIF